MATKRCESCGATVELEAHVFSTTCAFCDSPLVDHEQAGERPDRVVPFEIPRDRAGRLLRSWLAGRWLAPERLRRSVRPEALRQVFVPFYCYDALARTTFSARVGVYWYRTETYTTMVNGKPVVRTRQVRETEWFPLNGSHARRWFDHLVSASRGLPEGESNALEPFDLGLALPYSPALTAGVEAEHPTVPHVEARQTAAGELATLEERAIGRGHLPGDTHRSLTCDSHVSVEEVRLVMLPVWTAVYGGQKGPVRILVNGQTGEVVGEVPRSAWKVTCLVVGIVAMVGVVVLLLLAISGTVALLGSM